MFIVDILKSQTRDWYYVGHTESLENRLIEHNQGRVKSTKPNRPYEIIYRESFVTRSEAFKRE